MMLFILRRSPDKLIKSTSRFEQLCNLLPELSPLEHHLCFKAGHPVEMLHTFSVEYKELLEKNGFIVHVNPMFWLMGREHHAFIVRILAAPLATAAHPIVMQRLAPYASDRQLYSLRMTGGDFLVLGYETAHKAVRTLYSLGYVAEIQRDKVRV